MITAEDVQKMTKEERLQAIDMLWDSFAHAPSAPAEPDSPAWHGDVLAGRLERANSGKAKFYTIEELVKRVKKKAHAKSHCA